MRFLELLHGVVGVHLCGGEARMSQQFFHGIEVGPVVQQVRGEGVSEHVGAAFALGSDRTKVMRNEPLYGTSRDGFP